MNPISFFGLLVKLIRMFGQILGLGKGNAIPDLNQLPNLNQLSAPLNAEVGEPNTVVSTTTIPEPNNIVPRQVDIIHSVSTPAPASTIHGQLPEGSDMVQRASISDESRSLIDIQQAATTSNVAGNKTRSKRKVCTSSETENMTMPRTSKRIRQPTIKGLEAIQTGDGVSTKNSLRSKCKNQPSRGRK